ncbi:MAG: UvrD-helicase domain-containing protein [Rhodoferax sp.]
MNMTPAYERNGAPVSAEQFYAVACDPRRSVAVEACAGAGKTWMLVSRILRALLDGAAPHEILAITFTKKAAGEMRQRLQEWLAEFARLDDDALALQLRQRGVPHADANTLQALRDLHVQLLRQGRPVQVRTFHSWFAALLRSAPLALLQALELPVAYELLEDDTEARAQVWRRFWARLLQDDAAQADYRASVSEYGRHQTHRALDTVLVKRTEFALADAAGVVQHSVLHFTEQFPAFAGLQDPVQRLEQPAVHQLLSDAARALGQCTGKTCLGAATDLERALTEQDMPGVFAALLTTTGTARKLTDKTIDLQAVAVAQALLLDVRWAQSQHRAWQHQQRMARLGRLLLSDYAALKRERGWVDMADLECAALALLKDHALAAWVQERLDARVRHLLIDEFQDTNPLQWQALFAWLSGYAGAGQAPSVFLVGDPKQSIYRFRRAEPQVFRAAKTFVREGLGGDVLSCDHTRRNAPPIIALVNAVMGQAQQAGQYADFRSHTTDAQATGQVWALPRIERANAPDADTDASPSTWRDSLTTARHTAEETRKTLECRQAAQWLASQLQPHGTLKPEDIMVLSRKRERLALMEQELATLHIPTQQPEKAELIDYAEVQDIVALVDALVSPLHDLSLARALKSPLFGVGDAALVELALARRALQAAAAPGVRVGWLHTLQSAASLPEPLAAMGAQLTRWAALLASLPPHDALSTIFDEGDVLARFGAAAPAVQRARVLANLRALLHAALAVDGGRYTTAYRLVRALRAGGLPAPVRAQSAAVRLLTVHGAKGLEAPLVLLLDTDSEGKNAESMGVLVDWPGQDAHPRRLVFLARESNPPACVADALAAEQQERGREELNALYVALTRARQTLVISSLQPHRSQSGSWWERLLPLAQAAPPPLAQAPEASACESAAAPDRVFQLSCVTNRQLAPEKYGDVATKSVANRFDFEPVETVESRLGQALHRLLEWVAPTSGGLARDAEPWTAHQLAGVARAFDLDAAHLEIARTWALAVLHGQGAWAWDSDQFDWAANEVPLIVQGRQRRLDRLVRQRPSGAWWVLDYKSAAHPLDDPALRQQLHTYREAVALAYPGYTVHAAFLTPQGLLLPLPTHP